MHRARHIRHIDTIILTLVLGARCLAANELEENAYATLSAEFDQRVLTLVDRYCLSCHDSDTRKGELDLERFGNLGAVREDPKVWQRVVEQIESGEMPPEKKKQPTAEERRALLGWVKRYLQAEALAGAGDPGPVVLRRLSNAEYTYTVRDLTGIDALDPAKEFPTDSAAGEGFTNTGDALAMSPALFEKYFDAGKRVASHAVLLPDGFRFSDKTSRRDWSDTIVDQIRAFYREILQTGTIDLTYRAQVGAVRPADDSEGRLDHSRYFNALIRHRQNLLGDLGRAGEIARSEGLNAKYFTTLAQMLTAEPTADAILLNQLRGRWRSARAGDGQAIAQWIRGWQDQLWKFNPVGHLGGYVFDWQEPVDPLSPRRDLQVKLEPSDGLAETTLTLSAGAAGDGSNGDAVKWENPRIVRPGKAPILLRDVRSVVDGFARYRQTFFANVSKILGAAFDAKQSEVGISLGDLAEKHGVDPALLKLFFSYLGLSASEGTEIQGYLTLQKKNVGNQASISGWGMEGQPDLSLLGNSSDTAWRIPGEVPPHGIVVHPMPKRWVAAGWRSPIDGQVSIETHVQDRHGCGNGVAWSLQQRRGAQQRALRSGTANPAAVAEIQPIARATVRPGDLLSIVIDSRDGNHACDLTEIEIVVTEIDGQRRRWSLSEDCAGSILAGNPHADRYGNLGIWHFYSGSAEEGPARWNPIPRGSLLARWSETKDPLRAAALAAELQRLLCQPPSGDVSTPDGELVEGLRRPDGPLFSHMDYAALAAGSDLQASSDTGIGLDPQLFTEEGHLMVAAPSAVDFKLPMAFFAGAELVVNGYLDPSNGGEGSVQLDLALGTARASEDLIAGIPVTVASAGLAEKRLLESYAGFRDLFPAAMCYARVIPIDEVVTLVLYHREDDCLVRLMLEEREKQRLDRLWDELFYVSHDAFRMVVALEQILEFATQDADPAKFDPVLKPVAENTEALELRLQATEPAHLEALIGFAPRVYRRPLTLPETRGLRALYHSLRRDDLAHEEAFRLTLARLFAAAAFLYRAEQPGAGEEQGPVSPWEQATRLSYFLWASAPDHILAEAAAGGDLADPNKLVAHALRMLEDERARRLAIQFACQWLHVRDFHQFDEKNERLYPEFAELRGPMYEEMIRFFTHLFQKNGSILSILDADHTFVNGRLAEFYSLPGPEKANWRRVSGLRPRGRGGILGMAATLARQSGASRTSPILRGNWVSETLLGEKLPQPPEDVPQLPETVPEGLSERELIERHSSDPACAKCHARIDPYGLSLESFDAIGRFRVEEKTDTRAELVDGTALEGIDGLRRYLLDVRRKDFVRQFCRKLLGYALGRGVRLSDQPLLEEMISKLEADNYRFHSAVECIVRSRQFREIRGRSRAGEAE